jgi:hypothetical protein
MMKGQAAIRVLFKVTSDASGNLPFMPGIFPDYPEAIVRISSAGRELGMARRRMASSKPLMEATAKRATKIEAKGRQLDF